MDIEGERKMVSEESVVGSYELKNFEGEEVFQEAIDPLSHSMIRGGMMLLLLLVNCLQLWPMKSPLIT
jgi:hypothetical protein